MATMKKGASTAAATYSFSSQPKPVAASRSKYRDPAETDTAMYRDLKETSITWDRRVHRGNTYSMYTQNAIKEALQEMTQPAAASERPRRKRQQKEAPIFDMPLPEKERVPVDLTAHLVAKEEIVEVETVEAQTDEFLPEPPPEQYLPQKTGVDATTQVEDGELFNFDYEVEPILDVLVSKTLEQSIMEVSEESEMATMKDFKGEWYKRQETMMREWQKQVEEERVAWRKKEEVMAKKREEKKREAQVLLKIQAMAAVKHVLDKSVPNAFQGLQEVAFPDMKGMAINRLFLPQLLGEVQREVRNRKAAQVSADEAVAAAVRNKLSAASDALQDHRDRTAELNRIKLEELQIRQGKIHIAFDDDAGNKIVVGPIEICETESVDDVQQRIMEWLKQNDPKSAALCPHGVVLRVNETPVEGPMQEFDIQITVDDENVVATYTSGDEVFRLPLTSMKWADVHRKIAETMLAKGRTASTTFSDGSQQLPMTGVVSAPMSVTAKVETKQAAVVIFEAKAGQISMVKGVEQVKEATEEIEENAEGGAGEAG